MNTEFSDWAVRKTVKVYLAYQHAIHAQAQKGRPYLLEAVSLDTPGIVHAVTAILRSHGINIEDLETDTGCAPWTGAPMFRMKAHLVVGPTVSVARLKEELFHLQQEQDLDIALKPFFGAPESGEC